MNLYAFGLCLTLAGSLHAAGGDLGIAAAAQEAGSRRLSLDRGTVEEALGAIGTATGVRVRTADEDVLGRVVSVHASYRTAFEGLERVLKAAGCPNFAARRHGDLLDVETFCLGGGNEVRPAAGLGRPLGAGDSLALPRVGPEDDKPFLRLAQAGERPPVAPLPGGGPYDPAEINKRSAEAAERFHDIRAPFPFTPADQSGALPRPEPAKTAADREVPGLPPMNGGGNP